MKQRLVWAEMSLANLAYNFSSIKKLVRPKVKIMGVVKANAYGHGSIPIAKHLEKLGANFLGVACMYEAQELRQAGVKLPILILGYTDPKSVKEAFGLNITLNVMDELVLKELDKQARKKAVKAKIHLKIDTGMHRLGLLPEEALKFISVLESYQNIELEGIFTHFASADEKDLSFTKEQLKTFQNFINKLPSRPSLIHAANSAATLRFPSSYFSMVRTGKILYGPLPAGSFEIPFISKPILSLKTQVVQIRFISKGETVGYGRTFKAKKDTLVAAIPVGYADGFRRAPKNFGYVLIGGQKAPLLGRVSMDQSSINITNIPEVKVGDEVVIIGKQGKEEITVEEVAKRLGTINYEVVTALSNRVTRIYKV